MDEQFKKILSSAKEFWNKQSKKQKIIFFCVLGGAVVFATVLTIVLNIDTYVVIAQGLDAAQSSEMVAQLQESGVEVKVENGGVIKVAKEAESQALMNLAIAGYPNSAVRYDIFSQNVGFTSTEFEKNQYLRFQTEQNLASSIKTIPHVKDANVSIALADSNQYVLSSEKEETKASAKVTMYTGYDLSASQVKGIETLIAYGVPGLSTENVSVVDGNGRLLESGSSELDETAENKLRLSYERQVEENLKSKVLDILTGPFGAGGVSVAVTVELDYNKMISEEMSYMPSVDDKGMVSHEESAQNTDAQNTTGDVVGVEENAEVPTYPEVDGATGSQSTSTARSVDYLVSYIKTQTEKNGAQRKAVSISVMVNREVMTDSDRESLINAVAMAAGVQPENVSVLNIKFAGEEEGIISPELNTKMIAIVGAGALALTLLIILIVALVTRASRRKKERTALAAALAEAPPENKKEQLEQFFGPEPVEGEEQPVAEPKQPVDVSVAKLEVAETKETALKREIQTFSKDNPEIVAQLLRTWLKGDDDDGRY